MAEKSRKQICSILNKLFRDNWRTAFVKCKTAPGFSNYEITENGYVWSKQQTRWLCSVKDSDGYWQINLRKNKKSHPRRIHRLVLETFIGPCPKGMECRHLDGDKQNNNLTNLCWGTKKENGADRIKHRIERTKKENIMSKGHRRRPSFVSNEEYADNYNRIFKGVEPETPVECTAIVKYEPPVLEDEECQTKK